MPSLDLARAGRLEFEPPDTARFPCLDLACRALRGTEGLPIVLNAANEIAVAAFLDDRLPFMGIPAVIRQVMDAYEREGAGDVRSLEDVRTIEAWGREFADRATRGLQSMS